MAFVCHRIILQFGPQCRNPRLLNSFKCHPKHGACAVQVAHLTSVQTHEHDIKQEPPFTRQYSFMWQMFDNTRKRFHDNSKVIVVDGNLASGKTEFGEKLAKEFGMKFFPDEFEDNIFKKWSDFDLREFNPRLSPRSRFLDVSTFQMHKESPEMLQTIGRTQVHIYRYRFMNYAKALGHLLNTGQGVVVERGPWGDVAFADALRKHGYLSHKGLNFYNKVRDNSVCELWKPHLVIYLDAPTSVIRQRINARNNPSEMKGKVVTDDYLKTIENFQKTKLLPKYEKESKVLTFNLTDMPDWEVITEDLQVLDLEHDAMKGDHFSDWSRVPEREWNLYRVYMSNTEGLEPLFVHMAPVDSPEMMWIGEDHLEVNKLISSTPKANYREGYRPRFTD